MKQVKEQPLISIITPAYNAGRFIEDTLKNVMCQKYENLEHIVIDDGSTDSTVDILRKYESTYNLKWFSKSNEEQAVTVNKGFDIAKGQIVVWLNADDVLFSKRVIADVVETFNKNPEVDVRSRCAGNIVK
jgi:glycosyltransferase involved in cell wall biosynthesis